MARLDLEDAGVQLAGLVNLAAGLPLLGQSHSVADDRVERRRRSGRRLTDRGRAQWTLSARRPGLLTSQESSLPSVHGILPSPFGPSRCRLPRTDVVVWKRHTTLERD